MRFEQVALGGFAQISLFRLVLLPDGPHGAGEETASTAGAVGPDAGRAQLQGDRLGGAVEPAVAAAGAKPRIHYEAGQVTLFHRHSLGAGFYARPNTAASKAIRTYTPFFIWRK
jgi:hypothetical protein